MSATETPTELLKMTDEQFWVAAHKINSNRASGDTEANKTLVTMLEATYSDWHARRDAYARKRIRDHERWLAAGGIFLSFL